MVHAGNHHSTTGLSLRGHCTSPTAAQQLEQAVAEVLAHHRPLVWADCQRLEAISWHGQRAIFNAHQRARLAGTSLHWCGLTPAVLTQLADTGLHLLLHLLPAASYRGPGVLLQEAVPKALYTRTFG
ncbi:MAG: STAS domain-containing protein [Hymenobacter sp.]